MKSLIRCAAVLCALTGTIYAGYSPVTHCSSDDHECTPYDERGPWYRDSKLNRYEKREVADPTAALELDSDWAGDREEFSDTLYPVLR